MLFRSDHNSQQLEKIGLEETVVNCFQNCILDHNSQLIFNINYYELVVNCFQNCILDHNSQLLPDETVCSNRCELLSKLYFRP